MKRYGQIVNAPVPQTEPLDSRQVANNGGGYSYALDKWARLSQFLILGSEGGTYYVEEKSLTKQNYESLRQCLQEDGLRVVKEIVDISVNGRAPRQDAGIFALAVAASSVDEATRSAALGALPAVCRTGSTLFQFLEELKSFRKLNGRMFRRAIRTWYDSRKADDVAHQMVKYRQRNGWTHADVLRLGHPAPSGDAVRDALYGWAVDGDWGNDEVAKPRILEGFLEISAVKDAKSAVRLIEKYGLPREAVPTEVLGKPEVWEALLPHMPLTAMIRNLGNMSKAGLLTQTSAATQSVVSKLGDADYIKKSRVHPMAILIALKTYSSGSGFRGDNCWQVSQPIVGALDEAFYKAFGNVDVTGKRFMVGIDVSGSMGHGISNTNLTCTEAAAAMAMIWAATEPLCYVAGFNNGIEDLGFSRRMSLTEAMHKARSVNYGGTDCSLPMTWAKANKQDFDVFVVLTDNETNVGKIHPQEALRQYRSARVPAAREVVVGMVSNGFSIADPADPLTLDVVGFDATVPGLIGQFAMGKV